MRILDRIASFVLRILAILGLGLMGFRKGPKCRLISLIGVLLLAVPCFGQYQGFEAATGVDSALYACRDMIFYGLIQPSLCAPVLTDAEAAMTDIVQSNAVLSGISNLGGYGFPAPQGVTDPIAYANSKISDAVSQLNAAAAAASLIPPNTYSSSLNSALNSALFYLGQWTPTLLTGNGPLLFDLFQADYWFNKAVVPGIARIAQNDPGSAGISNYAWEADDANRLYVSNCFALAVGYSGWPVPQTRTGPNGIVYTCSVSPNECVVNILLFGALSNEDASSKYFKRGFNDLGGVSPLPDDVSVAADKDTALSWYYTDQAAYLAAELP